MSTEAAKKSTAPSQTVPFKKAPPITVRKAVVSGIWIELKRWPDGRHSIELSQRDRQNPERYNRISVGEFDSTGLADALQSFRSAAASNPAV